jgi:PA14 domain
VIGLASKRGGPAGRRVAVALELTILVASGVAGLLTGGTVVALGADALPLVQTSTAACAWLLCAGFAGLRMALGSRSTDGRLRRPLLLLTAISFWMLLNLVRPTLRAGDGLTAHYFDNAAWDGRPARSFVDSRISTARIRIRWNGSPPARFSARWAGYLTVGHAGRYRFTTTSDDGSQLFIDGRLVVDNGGSHSRLTRSAEIDMARGPHRLRLDYVQFGGDAELMWSWARNGGPDSGVPAWVLSRRAAGYDTVLAARFVDVGLGILALVIVLSTGRYVAAGFHREAVREVIERITADVRRPYGDRAALAFSVVVFGVLLCVPWPGGIGHWSFFRSVVSTIRDVHKSAANALAAPAVFQANLNTPRAGEEVLPVSVREVVAMLETHELERYALSDRVAANVGVYQQVVASAWPRRLERQAKMRFLRNVEPNTPGCSLIESRTEVSLVHCP